MKTVPNIDSLILENNLPEKFWHDFKTSRERLIKIKETQLCIRYKKWNNNSHYIGCNYKMDCIYAHTQDELEDKNKYDKKIKYLKNYILEYKLKKNNISNTKNEKIYKDMFNFDIDKNPIEESRLYLYWIDPRLREDLIRRSKY